MVTPPPLPDAPEDALQILTEQLDGGRVLYRSFAATNARSLYLNRNATYWKTADCMRRRLHDLYEFGWDYITSLDTFGERVTYNKPIYRAPTTPQMLSFVARLAVRHIRARVAAYVYERPLWIIGVRRSGRQDLLRAPMGHFWADPFLADSYLFLEDYCLRSNKGVISVLDLGAGAVGQAPRVALERPYHLSYPFTFQFEDTWYLLPETAEANRIELYRATEFPWRWELDRVLIDNVAAYDPTLVVRDDGWFLVASVKVYGGSPDDELHVYFADSLAGPWQPHPANPVVSDVRRARPAGRLSHRNGQLLRYGQDSSARYGSAISISRVDVLSRTEYREVEIGRITPDWLPGALGTHTFNSDNGIDVLDALVRPRKSLRRLLLRPRTATDCGCNRDCQREWH